MSVALISVSQDTVVSNKHEEQTRHYYVIFQQKKYRLVATRLIYLQSLCTDQDMHKTCGCVRELK